MCYSDGGSLFSPYHLPYGEVVFPRFGSLDYLKITCEYAWKSFKEWWYTSKYDSTANMQETR